MKSRVWIFVLAYICALMAASGKAEFAQPYAADSITLLLIGTHYAIDDVRSADAIVIAAMQRSTGALRLATIQRNVLINGQKDKLKLYASVKDGPQAVVHAVNQLFQLNIEHFVMVDLSGMEKIVDALGGIELAIDDKEWVTLLPDGKTGFHEAGMIMLSGAKALDYMKAPAGEDQPAYGSHISRVLCALAEKAFKKDTNELIDLISDQLPYVKTNMTLMQVLQMTGDALSVPVSGMKTKSFPQNGKVEVNGKETAVRITDLTAEAKGLQSFLYGP